MWYVFAFADENIEKAQEIIWNRNFDGGPHIQVTNHHEDIVNQKELLTLCFYDEYKSDLALKLNILFRDIPHGYMTL